MEVGSLVHEILARAARGEIALDSLSAASPLIPHADLAAHVDRPAEEASQVIGRALACEAIAEILDPLRAWRGLMTRAGLATMSAEHGAGRAEGERAEAARTGGAEVYSEWAFARSVGGAVQIGAIDRLILARDVAGCVRRAEVVDFKTDAIAPEEAAATYRGQLEAYREVVVESFGLPKESVEMRLVLLRSCLVVDLS